MKITKRQLRRIIKEEKQKLFEEVETSDRPDSIRKITADLLVAMNRGVVTAEPGDAPDELYIMTGDVQGVVVKVVKKGRY